MSWLAFAFGGVFAAFVIPLVCSLVKALLGIGPSGKVYSAPPIQEVIDAGGGEYLALENKAPNLTGKLFVWFGRFMWTSFGQKWILHKILVKNRIFAVRERYLPEAATFYPTPPFVPFPEQTGGDGKGREKMSKEEEIESLLQSYSPVASSSHDESEEFVFPSVMEYLHGYKSGRVTPEEVAERIIASIAASESLSPSLRAFVQWSESDIRKQAVESTRRYKENDHIRPLEGVPVALKEHFLVRPYELRIGCAFVPICAHSLDGCDDSDPVLRLRGAGAIIVGISNVHDNGIGATGSNPNELHLTPRNPYDLHRYTGGSSSGSASAVASGLVPLALGTDGGGSVRIPASLCGIVALKPTFGRISEANMVPAGFTLAHSGPMCASVADTALSYLLLSGKDAKDPFTAQQGPVTLGNYLNAQSVKGLKVGVYRAWFNHCDPEVLRVCEEALAWTREEGAEIMEIRIPEMDDTLSAHIPTFLSELLSVYRYDLPKRFGSLYGETLLSLAVASQVSGADYTMFGRQRTRAIKVLEHVFKQVDIIITPTTACTAHPIKPQAVQYGESDINTASKLVRFTVLGNLTGVPAIALPVGYDSNNLPISLQLMASWWREDLLFLLASQIEKRVVKRKPKIFYNIL